MNSRDVVVRAAAAAAARPAFSTAAPDVDAIALIARELHTPRLLVEV